MNTYASDQEQLEALKNWWKQNGKFLIVVIIIAIIASFAWRYWQEYRVKKSQTSSVIYEQMLTSLTQQQTNAFNQYANELETKYSSTPYADAAYLLDAGQDVVANDLDSALRKLEQVAKHGYSKDMRQIAAIRAARILLVKKNYQLALGMLNQVNEKSAYKAAADIVRGDVYLAMSEKDKARTAYQLALDALPTSEPMRALVQMKLNQLAVASK